jgi:hypothetical protein
MPGPNGGTPSIIQPNKRRVAIPYFAGAETAQGNQVERQNSPEPNPGAWRTRTELQ